MSSAARAPRSKAAHYRQELRADLARELHDGPVQSLTETVIRLERYRLATQNVAMQSAIEDVEESVRVALMSLRHLMRDLRGESPNQDTVGTIRDIAARYASTTGVETTVKVSRDWPGTLPTSSSLNLIRIVQEAITNAIRHGRPHRVSIDMAARGSMLVVSISDDGAGMPGGIVPGSGLIGMQERSALLGGALGITTSDHGTQIRVEFPAP